jgi:hypothetical protein
MVKNQDKSIRLENFNTISINKNDDKINILIDNDKNTDINFRKKDIIELFVINKENYMTEVKKNKIKYILLILITLFAVFSIITTIFATQYYYETKENILSLNVNIDVFEQKLYNFWIMILLNIIFTIIGVILLIVLIFNKSMRNTFVKMLIYPIILGVGILNFIISYYSTIYPLANYYQKLKNNEIIPKYYYNLITYVTYIPICLLILILFYFYSYDQ